MKHARCLCALGLGIAMLAGGALAAPPADRVIAGDVRVTYYREDFTDLTALAEYTIPTSATQELTWHDFMNLTLKQVSLARNEILARYGYVFDKPPYKEAFAQRSWYQPSKKYNDDLPTDLEWNNISLIKDIEAVQRSCLTSDTDTIRADLNGNGAMNRISRRNVYDDYDCIIRTTLNIDGVKVSLEGDDFAEETYLMDIDTRDGAREIAIFDRGPSDDPRLCIFRYDGRRIHKLGEVYAHPEDILFDGVGGFRAMERGSILHTWYGMVGYEVRGGRMRYVSEPYRVMNTMVVMREELELRAEPVESADIAFTAKRGAVALLRRTDDATWIEVVTDEGVGWMLFESYDDVNYFDGLSFAD